MSYATRLPVLQCISKLSLVLLLTTISNISRAQCTDGQTEFTWQGTGSGNQMVWSAGQRTGSDDITECTTTITVDVSVIDNDGVYYDGNQTGGNSTSGFFGANGLSMWLDNNDNLFDSSAMTIGEEASYAFDFSMPVALDELLTADIDWRNNGSISARWRDIVEVTAVDASGANVPLTGALVSATSTISIVGQVATADYNTSSPSDGGLDWSDPESQVVWSSGGVQIKTLTVTYRAGVGNSGQQSLLIGNMLIDADTDDDGVLNDVDVCEGFDDNADHDADGVPDGCDLDNDNDGILDTIENAACGGICDTDGDTIPDYLDLDSDNDGIYDVVEAGGVDADQDGREDDPDGDPTNNNGVPGPGIGISPIDTGNDGSFDFQNTDSDGDGCPDANEAYNNANTAGSDDGQFGEPDPASVDGNGLVTETGVDYTIGTNSNVTDAGVFTACCTVEAPAITAN